MNYLDSLPDTNLWSHDEIQEDEVEQGAVERRQLDVELTGPVDAGGLRRLGAEDGEWGREN